MNNPKVYIDRVTGTISISGRAGDYSGQCQAVQADAPAKFDKCRELAALIDNPVLLVGILLLVV